MLSFMKNDQASYWGSALLVVVASVIVGHEAATGMDSQQWICAVGAVLGSVMVAVMVRVWPASRTANEQR